MAPLATALALLALAGAPAEPAIARALARAPAGGSRAAAASRALVGAAYAHDPLGEGAGPDPDPRFRLDAFDCMTFVETSIALGSASSLDEARRALDDIRYAGRPARGARNHEVLSQWIPENLRKGWIAEAAREAAPLEVRTASKEYTAASWDEVRRAGRAVAGLPRSRAPLGRFEVPIVPAAALPAAAARLPEGALLLVVRADRADRATRISHAGLLVRGPDGRPLVRHATSTRDVERVIEEPIERFVRREERALPRWPVDGYALFRVPDNRARLAALRGAPAPAEGLLAPPRRM